MRQCFHCVDFRWNTLRRIAAFFIVCSFLNSSEGILCSAPPTIPLWFFLFHPNILMFSPVSPIFRFNYLIYMFLCSTYSQLLEYIKYMIYVSNIFYCTKKSYGNYPYRSSEFMTLPIILLYRIFLLFLSCCRPYRCLA